MFQYLIQAVLQICLLSFILFSERSNGAAYQYEACVPKDCGNGLNISFPFYIPGLQESYCGYPGFALNCSTLGFPVLHLPQNDYVVANISYQNRVFRVYDAVMSLNDSICAPSIKNTTLPTPQLDFVNVTREHLFPNCSRQLTENLWPYRIICNRTDGNYWDLSIDDTDSNLRSAVENCGTHIVVPMDAGNKTIFNLYDRLRWGFWLNWVASDCNPCEQSGGRCGFNETTYHFNCFCPDKPYSRLCGDSNVNFENPIGVSPTEAPPYLPSTKGKSRKTTPILATGVSVAVLMVTAISVILLILFRKKLLKWPMLSKAKAENQMDIKLFLKKHGNLAPKSYKYSEIKKMTKSFSDNLGKGGYGSVYKGKLQDGRLVAVKILHESKGNGEEFINEVASISRTSHVNIVTLLGFCFEGSKRALIYEFLANGSLEKYIPNTASSTAGLLGWEKFFEIAVGIARGLEYLHQGCNTRILHFDIKPHNILLDEDLKPKISDFGLAKLCPNRSSIVSMQGARGTAGYIAPEVFCRNFGEVSHKSDVYSYGMMVLEIVLGRKNIKPQAEHSSEMYFPDWVYKHLEQNVDTTTLEDDEWKFVKKKLIIIGLWCIQTEPKNRPSISRVMEMLEGKVECLQVPPQPYLSAPQILTPNISTSDSL